MSLLEDIYGTSEDGLDNFRVEVSATDNLVSKPSRDKGLHNIHKVEAKPIQYLSVAERL